MKNKEETLLDKAVQNITLAKMIYKEFVNDEVYLNYIGYHIQQAVELSIKYLLELNGIEYPKTHDISQLIYLAKKETIDLGISKYIEEHSEMFTLWESKTRYVLNYKLEKNKVEASIIEVEKYLDHLQKNINRTIENELNHYERYKKR